MFHFKVDLYPAFHFDDDLVHTGSMRNLRIHIRNTAFLSSFARPSEVHCTMRTLRSEGATATVGGLENCTISEHIFPNLIHSLDMF